MLLNSLLNPNVNILFGLIFSIYLTIISFISFSCQFGPFEVKLESKIQFNLPIFWHILKNLAVCTDSSIYPDERHNKNGKSDFKIEGKKYISASSGSENIKRVVPGIDGILADNNNVKIRGCNRKARKLMDFLKIVKNCIVKIEINIFSDFKIDRKW